jgi:predicted HicB family RNase H-like nuclease
MAPPRKTATLNLRIDPVLKEAVRVAALKDQRSVANLVEVLIRKHCEAAGIPVPEQQNLFGEDGDE